MGCLNMQTFIAKNPTLDIAGLIYVSPFFQFNKTSNLSTFNVIVLNLMKHTVAEYFPINTLMEPNHQSHDKHYFRRMNIVDGAAMPLLSPMIISSIHASICDVSDHAKNHTLPVCMMLAGRDFMCDNSGAQAFFRNIKTDKEKKQIK